MYLNLSDKQIQILDCIKEQVATKGYPPSVREICDTVGLKSTSTVHSHLNKLERLGYIKKDSTKPRAIEVLDKNNPTFKSQFSQEIINVPLVGQITAGEPILAEQNIKEHIPLPINLVKGQDNFILKVKGDSMINVGMLDGDYVIVDKTSTASNGQNIVALLYLEYATVKTFYKENDVIRLQPQNDFMEPILLSPKDVEVIGVVAGVFRALK